MSELVLQENKGGVRLLTLNRPDKLNALNHDLASALLDAIEVAHRDDSVAAVVLTGAGRAFSAGADMKEAESHRGRSHRLTIQAAAGSTAVVTALIEMDKPAIAAVKRLALAAASLLRATLSWRERARYSAILK
jgi:enoyl-CoA hydratase/carnithine racemase